jgi:hypothetical protein
MTGFPKFSKFPLLFSWVRFPRATQFSPGDIIPGQMVLSVVVTNKNKKKTKLTSKLKSKKNGIWFRTLDSKRLVGIAQDETCVIYIYIYMFLRPGWRYQNNHTTKLCPILLRPGWRYQNHQTTKLCPIFLRPGWRYQNDQTTNFA